MSRTQSTRVRKMHTRYLEAAALLDEEQLGELYADLQRILEADLGQGR